MSHFNLSYLYTTTMKVLLDKKDIYVMNEGKLEKQDSVWEFMKHPNRTFKRLMKYREMVAGANSL